MQRKERNYYGCNFRIFAISCCIFLVSIFAPCRSDPQLFDPFFTSRYSCLAGCLVLVAITVAIINSWLEAPAFRKAARSPSPCSLCLRNISSTTVSASWLPDYFAFRAAEKPAPRGFVASRSGVITSFHISLPCFDCNRVSGEMPDFEATQ